MIRAMTMLVSMLASVGAATTTLAQEAPRRIIEVTGTGTAQTMPDLAMLDISLRGEGRTADAAAAALAARQVAVAKGLAALLGDGGDLTTGAVTVVQARGGDCRDARDDDSGPRLSSGACAVTGYVAIMQASVRTHAVAKAATAVGLASRLGASEARIDGYGLSDLNAAQARARAAAVDSACRQATALAGSAGVRLGRVMTLRDQAGYDIVVTGTRAPLKVPTEVMQPPPVEIDAKPRPVETRAQVYVAYAIAD